MRYFIVSHSVYYFQHARAFEKTVQILADGGKLQLRLNAADGVEIAASAMQTNADAAQRLQTGAETAAALAHPFGDSTKLAVFF